jgi:acetyl-CoA acetyltransferase
MGASAAIAGLGITEMGKVYGRTASDFAGEAIALALEDAGLTAGDVDGLLVNVNGSPEMAPTLQFSLGLTDLTLLSAVSGFGATAGTMLQLAAHAVDTGQAGVVVCVYADAPLREGAKSSESAYSGRRFDAPGFAGLRLAYGDYGPANSMYALALRRHMHLYGTDHDQLGAIAVGQRQWALMNPQAQMRTPMALEDYHASRWVVEPLHLLDCCLVSNGGAAVVVTTTERAGALRQPPVQVLGWGQAHPGTLWQRGSDFGLVTGAALSGPAALKMAGLAPADIDLREIYDCYTYTVLVTLEDYGFCGKGEAGELAASGALAPGGALPTNTGGGQLSAYYLWGMTPLMEAVTQVRGQAGVRQTARHDTAIVSGNGGLLDHHATLVMGAT